MNYLPVVAWFFYGSGTPEGRAHTICSYGLLEDIQPAEEFGLKEVVRGFIHWWHSILINYDFSPVGILNSTRAVL